MYIDPTGHWAVGDNDRSAAAQAQILEATRLYNEAKQNKQSTTAAEKMANDARSGKIYYANAVSASDIDKTYNEVLSSKYVSQSAKSDLKSSDMNTISTAVYVAGARPVAQAELKSINQERKNSNEFNPNETSLNVNNLGGAGWNTSLFINNGKASIGIQSPYPVANNTYDAVEVKKYITSITASNSTSNQKQTALNVQKSIDDLIANGTLKNVEKGSYEYYALVASSMEIDKTLDKINTLTNEAYWLAFSWASMRFMGALEAYAAERSLTAPAAQTITRETINALDDSWGINASELKMTKTVQNHMDDIIKSGVNKGSLARPYVDSNGTSLILDEIMTGGKPVKDAVLKNGLKWNVEGCFNGSKGTWELVIDKSTNTIVHFNFVK
jgi:hypothetical protein